MGLGCAALTGNPRFPTFPNPLSAEQNAAGLSSPATAITLLGQGGAVLMLVLLFMAVTSSTSAEVRELVAHDGTCRSNESQTLVRRTRSSK